MAGYSLFYNITMLIIDHMIQIIYVLALQLCNCNPEVQRVQVCNWNWIGTGMEFSARIFKKCGEQDFLFSQNAGQRDNPAGFFKIHTSFTIHNFNFTHPKIGEPWSGEILKSPAAPKAPTPGTYWICNEMSASAAISISFLHVIFIVPKYLIPNVWFCITILFT